jgi:hypothetical protein
MMFDAIAILARQSMLLSVRALPALPCPMSCSIREKDQLMYEGT